jgi:hypothetical protein
VDIEIYNNDGRRFRATLVRDGETYGRNNVLTHSGAPLVQVRRWLATPELGEPADDWDADEPKYGPWLDQEF